MRRLFFFLVFTVTACAYAYGQESQIITDTLHSTILGEAKPFSVYLPAGYDDSAKEYPVLYLLHGAWGDHADWSRQGNARYIADAATKAGMAVPAIIVMPDASGDSPDKSGYRMGYFDKPEWNYELHFFEEFIPFVENKYRIRAQKKYRAIAGLSMGGGGSMVYALRHPELFGSCCPLSGLLSGPRAPRITDDDFMENIAVNDPQAMIRNADEQTLGQYRTVRWYIDCGDDDFLAPANVETYLLMKEKNIPLEYRMRDGAHDWEYWKSALPTVLQFISIGFAE